MDYDDGIDREQQALLAWIECWRDLTERRQGREIPPVPGDPDYGRDIYREMFPPTQAEIMDPNPPAWLREAREKTTTP